jgi:hypothetical protein
LRRADPTSKESYGLCIGSRNRKRGLGPTKNYIIIVIIIILNMEDVADGILC